MSLVYVTPSHNFPTGETLATGRRVELLKWANRVGAYVVEDDYDSDFRFDGPPLTALAGLEHSARRIYLGTFSKSIGAGLRVWLSAPCRWNWPKTGYRCQSHPQCRSKLARPGGSSISFRAGRSPATLVQVRMISRSRNCLFEQARCTNDFGEVIQDQGRIHVNCHCGIRFRCRAPGKAAQSRC